MFKFGKEFLLQTNHVAYCNFYRQDLPQTTKVERWILRLSVLNIKIEYQRGHNIVIGYVLSRLIFGGAMNFENNAALNQASQKVNILKSKVPRPNPLNDLYSKLLISDRTS